MINNNKIYEDVSGENLHSDNSMVSETPALIQTNHEEDLIDNSQIKKAKNRNNNEKSQPTVSEIQSRVQEDPYKKIPTKRSSIV